MLFLGESRVSFSQLQQEYFQNAVKRWNIKSGATRSGKTYMDYFVIPKRIRAVAGKDGIVVILGNTKGTLQRNIIEPLQKIWSTSLVSDIRSDNTAMLFGEKCYCLGADKISQVDRIRGSSIKYCYGDEIVTWNAEVFNMLKSRLDKSYSRFDGTCNPDSPNHWFYKFLTSENGVDLYLQKYQIYDNPYSPPGFVENLEKEYAGTVFFDRYILGNWVLAEGLIYPEAAKGAYTVLTSDRGYTQYYVSCDYGTLNPCSMGVWGLSNNVWYRIDEYYYSGRKEKQNKTDEEYYSALLKLTEGLPIRAVIVDPSAASFIACIRNHGKYQVIQAENAVLDGIRNTAVALNTGKIKICEGCKNALAEFGAYRWDEKSDEDKPIKENDHAMDDIRYFVNTILQQHGGKFINITY